MYVISSNIHYIRTLVVYKIVRVTKFVACKEAKVIQMEKRIWYTLFDIYRVRDGYRVHSNDSDLIKYEYI